MSKVEQLITEHIDIWTSAILAKSMAGRGSNKKYELYGIKKLRELILELAVRGKLVPQDSSDEPASVLLQQIFSDKAESLEGTNTKAPKSLEKVNDDEIFLLPEGWLWEKLGNLGETNVGLTYSPKDLSDKGIPVLRSSNIQNSKIDLSDLVRVNKEVKSSALLEVNDLLICARNGSKALVGKTAQVKALSEPMAFGAFMTIFRSVINNYVEVFLNSPVFRASLEGVSTTTINQITQSNLRNTLCPVPPLEEQHRIVAKVDELMLLCDQLEQQTETSIDAHATLVEVLLATLTDSADANELAQNWARVSEHFATLFTTEQSIEALKQTLLQLAVMGKLVPQDPDDEPAAVLLEKIAAEKAQLIKDKKIKKEKPLPPIGDDEKPFELPVGWEWVRLANVSTVGTGGTPSRAVSGYWESKDISWVTSGETSESFIFETKEKVSDLAVQETNVSVYPPGTLIIAMYGQGKTRGQVSELMIDAGTNQACAAIKLIQPDVKHRSYIKMFFLKSYDEIRSHAAGGAQPNLNVGKISSTVIPLPPLTEQHRIVTKIDELMEICDQLKANLQQSQETQVQLTDALIDQALC